MVENISGRYDHDSPVVENSPFSLRSEGFSRRGAPSKTGMDPTPATSRSEGMDDGFTGLLASALREPCLGMFLAVHLGLVLAFFVTIPYGKSVHSIYRYAALARNAGEQSDSGGETQERTAAAERFRERMKDLWGTIGCQTIQHVQGTGLWFPFTLEREYLMW